MKPSDVLFVENSPLGYTVACTGKQILEHVIECSGHDEMKVAQNIEAMRLAIINPEIVYESVSNPKRDVYFGKSEVATCGVKGYTKVIVEVSNKNIAFGDVITVQQVPKVSGGIKEGAIRYERDKKD